MLASKGPHAFKKSMEIQQMNLTPTIKEGTEAAFAIVVIVSGNVLQVLYYESLGRGLMPRLGPSWACCVFTSVVVNGWLKRRCYTGEN